MKHAKTLAPAVFILGVCIVAILKMAAQKNTAVASSRSSAKISAIPVVTPVALGAPAAPLAPARKPTPIEVEIQTACGGTPVEHSH